MKVLPMVTDMELIAGIQADCEESYEALYNKYASQLYVFTAHKLHSREIAEELVQDVFIKLWEKRAQLDIQTSVTGYLFKMMRNEILQYFRSFKDNEVFIEEMAGFDLNTKSRTDDSIHFKEMEISLKAIINALPQKCREIFIMSRDQELTVKQIAGKLDLSDQTVKNHITKALATLRKELKQITYLFLTALLLIVIYSYSQY
ncbi:RNA polymerase sigma-70 factor (ECF subfamily) [Chitinophaga niastensis]|uniref:RNA polymerase sigma-70 factor (ECF subfamily) n=1 Tax=Chitinophaga niastensis TaxID=536980 RepID=A0A2P8HP24_CHINA|nr:RNA polymerase sigma-70 factor [Chitinophaga niastensis]PSL47963.1 RNA polymerase sigma-70 factor (ECF subfamily) [Chitinophaga niastensis]